MSESYKGLTIPLLSDAADGPKAFRDLVDSGPIPRFATAAARDAAITAPIEGQVCYRADNAQVVLEIYTGSAWISMVPASTAHTHPAADIVSGVLDPARIPGLDATKIVTGVVDRDRLPAGTTSLAGILQLSTSVTSTSQTLAATASAVKTAMDRADAAYDKGNHSHSGLVATAGDSMTGTLTVRGDGSFSAPAIRVGSGGPVIYDAGGAMVIGANASDALTIWAGGVFYPNVGGMELGAPANPWGRITANQLNLRSPDSTSDNGIPSWRHNVSAGSNGWEVRRLTSSKRYKRNISDWDVASDLEKINRLRVVKFQPREATGDDPEKWMTGVIAEEAFEVYPHLITRDEEDRIDGFSYDGLIVPLLAAVQALTNRLDAALADG